MGIEGFGDGFGFDVAIDVEEVGFAEVPVGAGVTADGAEFFWAVVAADEVERGVGGGRDFAFREVLIFPSRRKSAITWAFSAPLTCH